MAFRRPEILLAGNHPFLHEPPRLIHLALSHLCNFPAMECARHQLPVGNFVAEFGQRGNRRDIIELGRFAHTGRA